jgi:hypothetical protein
MRLSVLVASAALAACASTGVPGSPSVETVRVASGNGVMTTALHPTLNANGGMINAQVGQTWAFLRTIYDSLGIAVATLDPAKHIIGNPDLKLRRRLGEVGLSKYIDCGNAQGSPSAETYEVRMSVLTQAQVVSEWQTTVLTTIEARAKPITMSGEFSLCSSTGALEKRILEMLKARLE